MLDTIFDKIYVVWGRDPDRKEYIQDHFSDRDIENYKFIRSITPRDLKVKKRTIRFRNLWNNDSTKPPDTFKKERKGSPYPLSLGEICCSYGHLKAYKTAIQDGCKTFLVVEDDAILDKEMVTNALEWKQYIPDNWNILHLHSWRSFEGKREKNLVQRRIRVNDYFYKGFVEHGGTVCYSLDANTAKYLLSKFYPINLPSDGITASISSNCFSRKYFNSYVINPFLCTGTLFESQIDLEPKCKGYITRMQRYNNDKINFDPNIL